MSPTEIRAELLERGWRKGSVLPVQLAQAVETVGAACGQPPQGCRYVIVSESCDVINGDFGSEPAVEVAALEPIDQQDGNFSHLRNPRELHFEASLNGNAVNFRTRIWNRGFLRRERLLEFAPDDTVILEEHVLWRLSNFFARRYARPSFSEEFDRRFRPVAKRLIGIAEKYPNDVAEIALEIEPASDLASDESYEVTVYFMLTTDCANQADGKKLGETRKRIASEIRQACKGSEGIRFGTPNVTSEGEITLEEWGRALPLDLDSVYSRASPE